MQAPLVSESLKNSHLQCMAHQYQQLLEETGPHLHPACKALCKHKVRAAVACSCCSAKTGLLNRGGFGALHRGRIYSQKVKPNHHIWLGRLCGTPHLHRHWALCAEQRRQGQTEQWVAIGQCSKVLGPPLSVIWQKTGEVRLLSIPPAEKHQTVCEPQQEWDARDASASPGGIAFCVEAVVLHNTLIDW